MIRSVLVLHGIGNHKPPEHWQFWLAHRLSERGHDVLYPALPDPDTPSLPVWMAALQRELSRMRGAERVVICHSLACMLWLHAAPVLRPDQRVDRLLLVSPPASERLPDGGADFRVDTFDAAAVRATVTGEVRIVCSDADPYNPSGAQGMYGDALGVTADVLRGAGHITPADGYGPWPSLEAWCDDARTRISTNGTAREHARSRRHSRVDASRLI